MKAPEKIEEVEDEEEYEEEEDPNIPDYDPRFKVAINILFDVFHANLK